MVPVVTLDRAVDTANWLMKRHLIDFRWHLSRAKLTQISAVPSGGTLGVAAGQLRKVGPALEFLPEAVAGFFIANKYVASSYALHGHFDSAANG